jgi:uncharacterized protein
MTAFQPNLQQRLDHLDVLRGFALLGILLVNFQWFTRPIQAIVLGADPSLAGAGLAIDLGISAFAEGKFYALFSMLFGAGFALMADRARESEAPFWGVYLRRLLVLAVFGLLHVALIWSGDILLVYSVVGFVMVLLFRNTPVQRLWKWALPFIFLPTALMGLFTLLIGLAQTDPEFAAGFAAEVARQQVTDAATVATAAQIYASGSFAEVVGQRFDDLGFMFAHALFWMPPVLGFFLLGRWLLVSGRLQAPDVHAGWLHRWRMLGLALGIPLSVGGAWLIHEQDINIPSPDLLVAQFLFVTGAALLALGYLCTVVLSARVLAWLAPVGRMALSNYLLQSLFWTLVFYGYGLGLWGQVPRALQPLCVVVFFAAQVALSHWWLQRFRFGPAEWLWRVLSYARMQPFRR